MSVMTASSALRAAPAHPAPLSDADLDSLLKDPDVESVGARIGVSRRCVLSAKMVAGLAPASAKHRLAARWIALAGAPERDGRADHDVLAWLLRDARQVEGLGAAVAGMLVEIAELHAMAAAERIGSDEWRSARRLALALADSLSDRPDRPCAELAFVAAWSTADAMTALPDSLQQWTMIRTIAARDKAGIRLDGEKISALMNALRTEALAAGVAPRQIDITALLAAKHPDEAAAVARVRQIEDATREACLDALLRHAEGGAMDADL